MTDSIRYTVATALVDVTTIIKINKININITVDLTPLDADEPDHSEHLLVNYISIPGFTTGPTYWWCKLHRKITVQTGSQARRVIKHSLDKIDDSISAALITRTTRKSEKPLPVY